MSVTFDASPVLAVGVPVGGGITSASNAPMSHFEAGRDSPRASVVGQCVVAGSPNAGLPAISASVCVGPPLSKIGTIHRIGFGLVTGSGQVARRVLVDVVAAVGGRDRCAGRLVVQLVVVAGLLARPALGAAAEDRVLDDCGGRIGRWRCRLRRPRTCHCRASDVPATGPERGRPVESARSSRPSYSSASSCRRADIGPRC